VEFVATRDEYASIRVDATRDRENILRALIKHKVSDSVNLQDVDINDRAGRRELYDELGLPKDRSVE
jgi:hypothetical protein